ncbi:hypothetical protein DENSPDRAFT_883688 [Dentipellis sp. KUC8613]|nr:hypothetical protein DENSPDRAFT_883688 [Dentipellis sp. KUC8613]
MSLARIPIILAVALSNHATMTPPNPPPEGSDKKVAHGAEAFFVKTVRWVPFLAKSIVWAETLCEVAALLALRAQSTSPLAARLLAILAPAHTATRIQPSRALLAGAVLALAGGAVRVACYRALGRLFTYELTVRRAHALVTQGPYSVVRHPSYVAGTLAWAGVALCMFGPGAWVRECGVPAGRAMGALWAAMTVFLVGNFVVRTRVEDEMMRREFGEEWERWAKRVAYRLVPGVF